MPLCFFKDADCCNIVVEKMYNDTVLSLQHKDADSWVLYYSQKLFKKVC